MTAAQQDRSPSFAQETSSNPTTAASRPHQHDTALDRLRLALADAQAIADGTLTPDTSATLTQLLRDDISQRHSYALGHLSRSVEIYLDTQP